MPQEEVKFFRDFFEYRKKYYNIDEESFHWWGDCVEEGNEIANKYANTSFYDFAIHLIVAHQKDVSRRYNGQ